MSQDLPKIRGVILDNQFVHWPTLRKVRNHGYPNTTDWFLSLVAVARDALDGGRIQISGRPLIDADDFEAVLPRGQFLQPFDVKWLEVCVKEGLLDQNHDGCFVIPRWRMWHRDQDSQAAQLRELPVWNDFLDFWYSAHQDGWITCYDLIDCAFSAKLRGVTSRATATTQTQWLGKKLSEQLNQPCGDFTIEKGKDAKNRAKYRLVKR